MKILLASNSFKECATASEINDAIEQGILLYKTMFVEPNEQIEIQKAQICDGGTGFASILAEAVNGFMHSAQAKDPLKRDIYGNYGVSHDQKTVFIEVAETCGLAKLTKDEQNPIHTTSFGVGTQFINAIEVFKPVKILIGCGDTAINDFGLGFLFCLGVRFLDKDRKEIHFEKPTDFLNVEEFDFSKSKYIDYLKTNCNVRVCCNLSSFVGGNESNTRVYAKQKGANDSEILQLENVRDKFLRLVETQMGKDISLIPGTGAGGGIGAALYAFCEARICYSFEVIFPTIGIEEKIKWADFVITGEGLVDNSSLKGKAPISLALFAKKFNKKVGLIAGAIKTNCTNIIIRGGVDYVETLSSESFRLEDYIYNSKILIRDAGFRLMKKIYQ